jgi:hypothetical protein
VLVSICVERLEVAWAFDSGEEGGVQTNPIVIGDIRACDARTGTARDSRDVGRAGARKIFEDHATTGPRECGV